MVALTLRIITPEAVVLDTTADSVVVTALDGELGILPRHAALVTALGAGELRFKNGSEETSLFVASGFCEVRDNTVRIVADASEQPGEIDVERAERAKQRAHERVRGRRLEGDAAVDIDLARADFAMRKALMRLKVAQRSGS